VNNPVPGIGMSFSLLNEEGNVRWDTPRRIQVKWILQLTDWIVRRKGVRGRDMSEERMITSDNEI
jgi:hypothetical protein